MKPKKPTISDLAKSVSDLSEKAEKVLGVVTETKEDAAEFREAAEYNFGRIEHDISGIKDDVKSLLTKEQFDSSSQRIIDNESQLVNVLHKKKLLSDEERGEIFSVSPLTVVPGQTS